MRRALSLLPALLLLAGCLRPYPELDDDLPPDAGTPPPPTEREAFQEIPDAQGELRFLAMAEGEDVYVSDGRSLWLRRKGALPAKVDLSAALGGRTLEAVGGVWGGFSLAGYHDTVLVALKAGGTWTIACLRAGFVLWARAFAGNDDPGAGAGNFTGLAVGSRDNVVTMLGAPGADGPVLPLPADATRPSFAMRGSTGRTMFFLPADPGHPARIVAADGYNATLSAPYTIPERPDARLTEAQCGLVVGQTGVANGLVTAVLFATEQGAQARYQGDQSQGTWELLPAAFSGTGRCLGAALMSLPGSMEGAVETYAFAHTLVVRRTSGWVPHAYDGVEASAAATYDGSSALVLAGTLSGTGKRGLTITTVRP